MPSVLNKISNRQVFKTLSFRIAFLFGITFTLGITLAFTITYVEMVYSLEQSSKEVITSKLSEITTILNSEGLQELKTYFSSEKNKITNAPFMVRVLSSDGNVLYIKPSVQVKRFDFKKAFQEKIDPESILGWHSLAAINDEDKFDILTAKIGAGNYLQVGKSSEDREAVLGKILEVFGTAGILLILLSGGLGLWYATKSLKPLKDLVKTIHEIEMGDLTQRVQISGAKDELHDLGSTFNRMIDRIETLIRIMKESLDNVAHDIRTPLTRMKAVAEDALLSNQPVSLKEALEECAEDATNISDIVDQLMSISEAEAGTMTLKHEACDVRILLMDVIDIYEFVALDKSIQIVLDTMPNPLWWILDRKKIKQVIANLLDNALKFSEADSKISIQARIENDFLRIMVIDEGCGISSEDSPRIWDRLFRGDRSRSAKGAGLGLSIVRAIVTAHSGTVGSQANPERGTTFFVKIPQSIQS